MNRQTLSAIIVLLLPVLTCGQQPDSDSAPCSSPLGITASGGYSRMYGDTRYGIEALVESPYSAGEIVDLESELMFPLDVGLIELRLTWRPSAGTSGPWSFSTAFAANVSDPASSMTDKDWLDHTLISSTDSGSELAWRQITASMTRTITSTNGIVIALVADLDYVRLEHTIVGYVGWYDVSGNGVHIPIQGTEHVLDYELTSLSPTLGASIRIHPWKHFEWSMTAGGGFTILTDRDDHILRGRISEGEAIGLGLTANSGLSWVYPADSSCGLRLGITGDLRYFHGEGEQVQRWYQDEGDIPAGTEVSGIPVTFDGLYYRIGIIAGFTF